MIDDWWLNVLSWEKDPVTGRRLRPLPVAKLKVLREWLRDSDPVAGWPIEERCARVRRNVMAAIESERSGEEGL
jgi:hypothetical protein